MKCAATRELIQKELDGTLSSEGARALVEHVEACEACRLERETMRAIDSALGGEPIARAPAWLESSVLSEIAGRAAAGRRVDSVVLGVACGTAALAAGFGVARAVSWEAVAAGTERFLTAARGLVAPLADLTERAPDFVTVWSNEPGAVGFLLALAAAATAFITISALRAAKQLTLELR
jgi:anti-sigma factor RsiW